ncbi:hypothetical protein FBU59_000135 [Linderina macrospora]|uniref:Uncharacterized protein n=1 Tax=Linderina macrospora TaxID=4868 RepID=A0ACC1JHX6_9FUNG|nr:hypothetical protein FBU59_000135 [Linderina macrospora]
MAITKIFRKSTKSATTTSVPSTPRGSAELQRGVNPMAAFDKLRKQQTATTMARVFIR